VSKTKTISHKDEFEKIIIQIRNVQLSVDKDLKISYSKLDKQFNNLVNSTKRKKSINRVDRNNLKNLLYEFRCAFIKDQCKYFLDKINSRKSKTQSLADIENKISDIKKEIDETNLSDKRYEEIYFDIFPQLGTEIKSRLEVDKNTKTLFWKGIWIGGLIGFILGMVGSIIVNLLL